MHQFRPAIFLMEMTQSGRAFLEEYEETGEWCFGFGYTDIEFRLFRLLFFTFPSDELALLLVLFCPSHAVLLVISCCVNFLWQIWPFSVQNVLFFHALLISLISLLCLCAVWLLGLFRQSLPLLAGYFGQFADLLLIGGMVSSLQLLPEVKNKARNWIFRPIASLILFEHFLLLAFSQLSILFRRILLFYIKMLNLHFLHFPVLIYLRQPLHELQKMLDVVDDYLDLHIRMFTNTCAEIPYIDGWFNIVSI
jgi:hypothetical protein